MELQRATPPLYHAQSPVNLGPAPALPDQLARFRAHGEITLPDLKTVLSPGFQRSSPPSGSLKGPGSPASVRSLPRISARTQLNGARGSLDGAVASPSEAGSYMSTDNGVRRSTDELSAEEIKMREAAEALAGLGNPDFARSPNASVHMPSHARPSSNARAEAGQEEEKRPLLNLLTEAHPWVGGTINGTRYVYSTTKSLTPQFVQASANMVERSIATPIVNTVGSVGRITGAKAATRWYLTPRGGHEAEREDDDEGRRKKRRVMDDDMDIEPGIASPRSTVRRDSNDSLPAYGASKPPSYREEASPATVDRSRPTHNRTWSQQLVLHASGLGVAMSETSRNTLVYCLNFLSRSAEHIATVMNALKLVLEQYDEARDYFHQTRDTSMEKGERPRTPDHDDAARRLAGVIKKHCDDIWNTLKTVVHSVSNTAGGALPNHAREFVRNQLMSLPRRWQMVSNAQMGESETSRNAHRMIAFATEGLDMIGHVSAACEATLDSAEGWVQVVGRRRPAEERRSEYPRYHDEDHEMANGDESQRHPEKQ